MLSSYILIKLNCFYCLLQGLSPDLAHQRGEIAVLIPEKLPWLRYLLPSWSLQHVGSRWRRAAVKAEFARESHSFLGNVELCSFYSSHFSIVKLA